MRNRLTISAFTLWFVLLLCIAPAMTDAAKQTEGPEGQQTIQKSALTSLVMQHDMQQFQDYNTPLRVSGNVVAIIPDKFNFTQKISTKSDIEIISMVMFLALFLLSIFLMFLKVSLRKTK